MKMRKITLIGLLLTTGYAGAAPLACLIEPEKVAEVGVPSIGIIEKVAVERGDYVKAGQVVAFLKADVERASVNVASVKAQAEADLKAASASYELAQAKMLRARDLVRVGFISKEAGDQAEAEARIAQNRVVQAEESKNLSQQELALSSSQFEQRKIRSPFPGIVVDRYRTEGERVEREPIVRIAKVDPLRVEVILPVSQFGQVELGSLVNIKTDIAGGKNLSAKVVLIDSIIDAASNTFRVRLSLPNPDHTIPAGLRCIAEFTSGNEPSVGGMISPAAAVSSRKNMIGKATPIPTSTQVKPDVTKVDRLGRLSYQLQPLPKGQQ